jgi:hypothetical protein
MSRVQEPTDLITPPADVPEERNEDWLLLPVADPVTEYIAAHHWDRTAVPISWEVARLSRAAYVYRETDTRSAVMAKFYTEKMGEKSERYARREFERSRQARAAGLAKGNARAVRPLASWRGVLLLEYVDGLTLEDIIAVRRSRPGTLASSLEKAAQLLATLHNRLLDGISTRPLAMPKRR